MECVLILKIEFGGKSKLVRLNSNSTYQNIVSEIHSTWNNVSSGIQSIFYSVGSVKNCCLDSEEDFIGMVDFCNITSAKVVDISFVVHSQSNHSEVFQENSVGLHISRLSNEFNLGSTSSQNNIVGVPNKGIIVSDEFSKYQMQESSEFDGACSIPNFDICPIEKQKTFLSDQWKNIMSVGAIFPGGASEFRIELVKYSTKLNFQFTYTKNSPRYIYVRCGEKINSGCMWFINAKQTPMNDGFIVSKANLDHTCIGKLLLGNKKRFGTKVIKDIVFDTVKCNPTVTGKDIMINLKKDYGLDIPYYKAWRGIEAARDDIFGSYDESYDQLRWYSEALERTNPGSIVDLEKNSITNHFERIFISFHACKEGFKTCRPLLFIDGTFMKGRSKGVLLAATAKDGNNGLFPVAFAVVSAENRNNWTWFLTKLRDKIHHPKQVIYISDRNTGLMLSFYDVWENPPHFYCLYHLLANLKGRYGGGYNTQHRENMSDLFKQCAYAPTLTIFKEKINKFKEVGGHIAELWLEDLPYQRWAVSHSPHLKRYGEMTSNAAESFNSWIREARGLPITYMIDAIRKEISRWFVERREISSKWTGLLVPTKENLWNELCNISASWLVSVYPNGQFSVASKTSVTVDLEYNICTCFQWQITGFPCAHAVAVIKKHCDSLENVIEDCFMTANYKQCYQVDLIPVPDTERFQCKANSVSEKILPPILNKPPGRPKQKRITSYGEFRKVKSTICKRCGKKGRHDALTCGVVFGNDRTNVDV